MNWEGHGRKRSWPNLRYYLGVCLVGLKITAQSLSQDSRSSGRDLKPGLLEYEGVLIARPGRSIFKVLYFRFRELQKTHSDKKIVLYAHR
jgi:hypothetical protein